MIPSIPKYLQIRALFVLALLSLLAGTVNAQNLRSEQLFAEPSPPSRDPAVDLAMKITAPFSVASVGDVMVKRTGAILEYPEFQQAFALIRDADIGVGNMEGNLADIPRFDGPLRGVEIYKGKPIFYGMGEFFYQWQHMDAALMSGAWEGPISQLGMPRMAPPDMAQEFLQRVQNLSIPFATSISIEDNVGIIRVPNTAVSRN